MIRTARRLRTGSVIAVPSLVGVTTGGTEVDQALIAHVLETLGYEHSDESVEDEA